MAFSTSADIVGDSYGKNEYDTNNNCKFVPLGRAVFVNEIVDNIETQETSLKISFRHRDGKLKHTTVSHQGIGDGNIITELAKAGADVPKKNANIVIDTIRLQEDDIELSGQGVSRIYKGLGWIRLPFEDSSGQIVGSKWCFRSASLIGHISATYSGDYMVSPKGSYEVWRDMVKTEILGRPTLEILLVAGLSAVINGLIAPVTTGENPIVHVSFASGKGKSTIGHLLASTAGKPFNGQQIVYQRDGTIKNKKSLYRSWGATETAIIQGCAGNRGAVVIFNELSKLKKSVDVDNVIYNLSEGSDKDRGSPEQTIKQTDYYATTFISFGESSLLEKCKGKEEGLRIRVMEIEKPLTESAEHADKISKVCYENNGFAAPMIAKYILDNGGITEVLKIYEKYKDTLPAQMPDTPSKERFIAKFAALFMTTAEIATSALNIPFDLQGILNWLQEYENENGKERNTSASSYEKIIEDCRINSCNFYRNGYDEPKTVAWGTIKYFTDKVYQGKLLQEEYAIRKTRLQEILDKYHFPNIKTCIGQWKAAGVLSHDSDKPTRSRKIGPRAEASEDVYVFLVFSNSNHTAPKSKLVSQATAESSNNLSSNSKLDYLLSESEDEDDE